MSPQSRYPGPGLSAVAAGAGGRAPLTAACAPPFRFTQNPFLEHLVMTRQQAIMEKGIIITFKHNSRLKVSSILCEIAANQLLCINATQ